MACGSIGSMAMTGLDLAGRVAVVTCAGDTLAADLVVVGTGARPDDRLAPATDGPGGPQTLPTARQALIGPIAVTLGSRVLTHY